MSWTAERFRRKGRPPLQLVPDAPIDSAALAEYKNPAPPQNGPPIVYKYRPDGRLLFASCG